MCGDMKNVHDLLKKQKLKEKLSRRTRKEEALFTAWEDTAGRKCNDHTSHLTLLNGILSVYMDSPVWRQELMMSDLNRLAEKMESRTGFTIAEIRIRTGRMHIT